MTVDFFAIGGQITTRKWQEATHSPAPNLALMGMLAIAHAKRLAAVATVESR